MTRAEPGGVEIAEIGLALRRGWAWIAGALTIGILGAFAVLRYASPTWTAHASVLVRDAAPLPSALAQSLGGSLAGGAASALLGGALKSSVETDMALLKSRELVGEVVDSLGLQIVVTAPHGTQPARVVQHALIAGSFRPLALQFDSAANGVHVTGKDVDTTIARGGTLRIPPGTIELASNAPLPSSIRVFDREDAVTRSAKRLGTERVGGDVVGVAWPAEDSLSAPAAANLLIDRFLVRRKGVDRGLNQKKLEFVTHQIDSTDRALDMALRKQRDFHERAQTVDPAVSAKAYLETLLKLREQRETLVMEEHALTSLEDQLKARTVQPRQLAAYPAFLRSPAINELLGKIGALEAERAGYLKQGRLEDDPKVAAARAGVASLEHEIEPLARTYSDAISQQRSALDTEISSVNDRLAKLPTQVEEAFQLLREVERLSKTSLALNAQRVELRLATIGEGGEASVVDVAYAQWKKSFPSKLLTLFAGAFGGLALGFALALLSAFGTTRGVVRATNEPSR